MTGEASPPHGRVDLRRSRGTSEVWDHETASRYDETSAEMFAPEVLGPTVEFLAALAQGGPVLEFAVGTGRVAVPLVRGGLAVTGVELSDAMVAELRRKVTEQELPVVVGDMASVRAPGAFRLVYVVWNSISNLQTQREQAACFQNAARHLVPGGRFVVELWVPRVQPRGLPVVTQWSEAHVCIDTHDTATQACASHHFFREADGSYRKAVGHFRYAWPAECDLFAQLAGLELEARFGDWDRRPFTDESGKHVSVWRKPL